MRHDERPVIGFLTDFGLDSAAATCRGVMLGICRDAQIVDICHTVRKYAIRDGAYLLRASLPYLPVGVHVGVIDPGVGTDRRPIAVLPGRGDVLVGPDNGLLVPPADALGGIRAARALDNRSLWLSAAASSTFHGRDIFAPVAARLAAGEVKFEEVGSEIDPADLARLPTPVVRAGDGVLQTAVTYIDSFGNVRLGGGAAELAAALGEPTDGQALRVEFSGDGGRTAVTEETRFARTFGDAPLGTSLLYVDSSGNLALADNQGNAAARLGVVVDQGVRVSASSG
jgi:S-adenosylmethionine hydrolase